MDVVTYRPDPSEFAWTFGGVPPVRKVKPGDLLELWTEDAFGGKVRGVDDLVSKVIEFPFVNPQTGPFFVEGAEPGDTLAIHFVSIEPSRDWAASCTVPLFGALTSTHQTATLQQPLPEVVWIYDAHGGNMDTPEMRAGTTCYLGVNVEGALFSIGDGHCRQGEGETCGVAVEAAMDTVIAIDLVKGRLTPWPRLENDSHVMSAGSTRPLEDAFRIAHVDMITWLCEEFGFETLDAYQFLTQVSESPVANVCDPNYTFVTKVAKRYLPNGDAYGGMHGRLNEVAETYRRGR